MKTKQKDLLESALKELQFANLQIEILRGVLSELKSFTGTLEVQVIENAEDRHMLDKAIHAKIMFKAENQAKGYK